MLMITDIPSVHNSYYCEYKIIDRGCVVNRCDQKFIELLSIKQIIRKNKSYWL